MTDQPYPRFADHEPYPTAASQPPAGQQQCPYCMFVIPAGASVCAFCARDVVGPTRGEVRMADRSARRGIGVLLFIVLAQLILLLALVAYGS